MALLNERDFLGRLKGYDKDNIVPKWVLAMVEQNSQRGLRGPCRPTGATPILPVHVVQADWHHPHKLSDKRVLHARGRQECLSRSRGHVQMGARHERL